MTPESVGPLSRPVAVRDLPLEGVDVTVEATSEELAALATDFKLPAIHELTGTFHLSGSPRRVRVVGRVRAAIRQTCVVTLESFDTTFDEDVEVDFASPRSIASQESEGAPDNWPDEITDGRIDLGVLTAEFLALGLDPYPRKPGAAFAYEAGEERASPFAALGKLKGKE
jgi:hypothetical protein